MYFGVLCGTAERQYLCMILDNDNNSMMQMIAEIMHNSPIQINIEVINIL